MAGTEPGALNNPMGIAFDQARGRVVVADTFNDRVQVFSPKGELLCILGSRGVKDGEFRYPFGVAVDKDGNIYVADKYNNRVQRFNRVE